VPPVASKPGRRGCPRRAARECRRRCSRSRQPDGRRIAGMCTRTPLATVWSHRRSRRPCPRTFSGAPPWCNDSSSTGTKATATPSACVILNFGAYLAQRPASRRPMPHTEEAMGAACQSPADDQCRCPCGVTKDITDCSPGSPSGNREQQDAWQVTRLARTADLVLDIPGTRNPELG
jgi:hypothetical protein